MNERQLLRTVFWQRLDRPGSEYMSLWKHQQGWELSGRLHIVLDSQPRWINYQIFCDVSWRTSSVDLLFSEGFRVPNIRIWVSEHGRWLAEFKEFPELQGCTDFELVVSPATNTLAIRRLGLEIGESQEVCTALMRFPDLELQAVRERYTRIDQQIYHYENDKFAVDIEVDELGLVVAYPEAWQRMAIVDG
jgi:hypothetical protein